MENLAWLQPVIIGAVIVFVLDLIGNMLSFSNRFLNALTTAAVFAILFGSLFIFGVIQLDFRTVDPAAITAPVPAPSM